MVYDDEGGKFLVTGTYRGKAFEKLVEALSEADAADHCQFFLMYELKDIQVSEYSKEKQ